MYIAVDLRLKGGRQVWYYGSVRTRVHAAVAEDLVITDGDRELGRYPWLEWTGFYVSKTEHIPTPVGDDWLWDAL